MDLVQLVINKCEQLGPKDAAEYFSVSEGAIHKWRKGVNLPSAAAIQKAFDEFTEQCPVDDTTSEKIKAYIAAPVYDSMEPSTFRTLFRTIRNYGSQNVEMLSIEKTLIARARNTLAHRALQNPNAEYIVFPDDDMLFPCSRPALLNELGFNIPIHKARVDALTRIMSHPADKTIVGGLYRDRKGKGKVICASALQSSARNAELNMLFDPQNTDQGQLVADGWVGFGFVRVHRKVFEDMKENVKLFPEIKPDAGGVWAFFKEADGAGEDVSFCRRAQKIGHTTYIDTGLLLGHIGKKVY